MSVDVATLVFDFKSDGAETAEKRMDALIDKGEKLEAVSKRVRKASEVVAEGHKTASGAAEQAARSASAVAQAEGVAERATRASAKASAELRQLRALEAKQAKESAAQQKAAAAEQAASDHAAAQAAKARANEIKAAQALELAAQRELVAATKAYERDQAAAARTAAAEAKAAASAKMQAERQAASEARATARAEATEARVAATAKAQADREAQRSAQQLFQFRARMAQQQAAEEAADARAALAAQNAADRESERSAAQVLAFRQRMARQRAAEEAAASRAANAALDVQIANAIRGQVSYSAALGGGARASKQMALSTLDLSRQFADVAVTAGMGMNPFMIILQQGPQIADRLALMKTEGIGLGSALKSMAVSMGLLRTTMPAAIAQAGELAVAEQAAALAALEVAGANRVAAKSAEEQAAANTAAGAAAARLAAANEAVAATAAEASAAQKFALTGLATSIAGLVGLVVAFGTGWALMYRQLEKGFPKDVTKGMDLTEEQLDRVKHKTVTMGDTFHATLDVMGKYLMSGPLGDAFKWLSDAWNATLDFITKAAFEGTARLVGFFVGAYRTVRDNWRNFPAVLGDAFASAVNLAIDGVQKLVNASVKALNVVKAGASAVNPVLRLVPDVPEVDLSKFKLQVSSAAEFTARAFASNIDQATEDARAGMRKIGSEIQARAMEIARARALAEAGKPNKGRASKADADDPLADALAALRRRMREGEEEANRWMRALREIKPVPDIGLQIAARDAQAAADSASTFADEMSRVADASRDMANSMADGFGAAGRAIGGLIDALGAFQARQADIFARQAQDIADRRKAILEADGDQIKIGQANDEWARKRIKSEEDLKQIEAERNVDAIRGVKSLLSEKSAAYKILTGLEVALQALELAGNIKSIAMGAIETARSIANAIAQGAAWAAAGAAKMFSQLGVFAFPVVGAMIAMLVGLGLSLFGGGGGSKGISAEDRQKTQGTGSVLGDTTAKSESIARSLDIVAKNTNRDLEYSNAMVRSLHSIDQNIGALTNVLARQLGISGGSFDTSNLGLGSTFKKDIVGSLLSSIPLIGGFLGGLFGKKVTTTLLDQGVQFGSQSLADILSGGVDASAFQDVQTQTKKKFLGITTSNKTKTETVTSGLDADVLTEIQRVVSSLRDGVLSAASVLGVEGAKAAIDAFTVDLGKVSFKDMTGQEINDALNAIFGKLGDDLAATAVPALEELQQAGEGAFETLVRLAREYQVVDVTLQAMGKTFGAVGVSSLAARDNLVKLFGSLDDFVDASNYFTQHFLSEAEQMAPIQSAIQAEFARLGVTGVNTKDQFKQLVLGLDLTTQAGQEMYAALLQVAPAFDKVFSYLNPEAAQAAADGWNSVFQNMQDWIRSLNDEITGSVQTTAQAYSALQSAALAARGGDLSAANRVEDLGKAYLNSVRASATSDFEYLQAVARVRAIASSVQNIAGANSGMNTGATGSAAPFSPQTSATGSTAPAYTYQPKPSFDSTGSFTVAGSGPQDFGPVTLHGGEIVDVRKPYQSSNDNADLLAAICDLKAELAEFRAEQRNIGTQEVINTGKIAQVVDQWQGEGLPPERDEAA